MMPRYQWQDNDRIFTALALMDTHGIGKLQFSELITFIVHAVLSEQHRHMLRLHIRDKAYVPVEHTLVIVILGLHHLIPKPEGLKAVHEFRFCRCRGIERRLKSSVQIIHPALLTMHGGKHLNILHGIKAHSRQDFRAKLHYGIRHKGGIINFQKMEVTILLADWQSSTVYGMCIHHNGAVLILTEDFLQSYAGQCL